MLALNSGGKVVTGFGEIFTFQDFLNLSRTFPYWKDQWILLWAFLRVKERERERGRREERRMRGRR